MLTTVLAVVVSVLVTAAAGQEKDPLLLEYSDYYYDLYYGDYAYDALEGHVTAPRSIGKDNPPPRSNSQTKHNRNKKKNKFKTTSTPLPPPPALTTPALLPLNVRLQRLVNNDDSAAEVILDILDSPASVQKQIKRFLEGILDANTQLNRQGHSSNSGAQQQLIGQPRPPRPTQSPATKPPQTFLTQTPGTPPPTRPTRPTPPPTRATRPTPRPTRPTPRPTRPTPRPTRPPPPPTRPPPPPTRPPTAPPTRPPPPPPTRPPRLPPIRSQPPPTFQPQEDQSSIPASRIVQQAFNQFPNFQNQGNADRQVQSTPVSSNRETPRSSGGASNRPTNNSANKSSKKNNPRNQGNSNRNEGFDRGSQKQETTPTSGLTIQEFLTRYPEVKRLSSRFNKEGEDLAEERERTEAGRPAFTAFSEDRFPGTEPPPSTPAITPRQRATPPPPNNFKQNNKAVKPPRSQQNHGSQKHSQQSSQSQQNSRPHKPSSNTQFQQQQNSRPHKPSSDTQLQQQQNSRPHKPSSNPQARPQQNSRPQPNSQQNQRKNKKQSKKQPNNKPKNKGVVEEEEYPDYTLDYDYYYDQLVPEHERFFQLPKLEEEPVDVAPITATEKTESFQIFTHFAVDKPAPPPPKARPTNPPPKPKAPKKKNAPKTSSSKNSIAPATPIINGQQAGPFGYPEKGSFFSDTDKVGFPERIDMVYQGFVWAFDVFYPDQGKVRHGGVHRILEDKVKREKINLKEDHIIRITGRASPYNINRLTFHTAAGKVYGPWGDRHSEDSVDFDVAAPPGHALASFSGTVDFGVPLRSIAFHWAKL